MCTPGIIFLLYKLVKGGVSQASVFKLSFYARSQREFVLFYFYYIFNTEYIRLCLKLLVSVFCIFDLSLSLEVHCNIWRKNTQFINEKAYNVRNSRICEKLRLSVLGHGLGRINCSCSWHECVWGHRIIAACIFKLSLKFTWATDCTAKSLYPWGDRK
jgi:hypothetical protein